MIRKLMVISAVNFDHGGPLSILKESLDSVEISLGKEWKIIAFVHNKKIFNNKAVKFIEIPWAKKSWFLRLYVEWVLFKIISTKINVDLWISLHDITPNVNSKRKVVYCHNPSPFYKPTVNDAKFDFKFYIFTHLYKYIYILNIKKNYAVIVQQTWIKSALKKITKHPNILVARPSLNYEKRLLHSTQERTKKFIFLYPAFPRVFKNFELICEAYKNLPLEIKKKCELRITIDGSENLYSKFIYKKYKFIEGINFLGVLSSRELDIQYSICSCLIFPSKLETWGLPITEAKEIGLPIIVANSSYARETVGEYNKVEFIDPYNVNNWRDKIIEIVSSKNYKWNSSSNEGLEKGIDNWNQLFNKLIQGL